MACIPANCHSDVKSTQTVVWKFWDIGSEFYGMWQTSLFSQLEKFVNQTSRQGQRISIYSPHHLIGRPSLLVDWTRDWTEGLDYGTGLRESSPHHFMMTHTRNSTDGQTYHWNTSAMNGSIIPSLINNVAEGCLDLRRSLIPPQNKWVPE